MILAAVCGCVLHAFIKLLFLSVAVVVLSIFPAVLMQ